MTVDLGAIATRSRAIIASALATSGVTLTFTRDPDDTDETVDFTTLAPTDPTPETTVAANVQALIAVDGNPATPAGRDREVSPTEVTFVVDITVTDPQVDDIATVNTAPDSRLVGARLRVTAVADDGLGIARKITARRI